MKAKKIIWAILTVAVFSGSSVKSQGNLLKTAKDKASTVVKNNKDTDNKTTETTSTVKPVKIATSEMESGKGYFSTSFKQSGYKEEVKVGDELFVRMYLGKTMIDLSKEKGIQADYTAYGFVTVYIDDKKSFTAGPYSFASNYAKSWLYIDIPLNINADFAEKLSSDQSMLETDQDIWVFQQLYQDENIPKMYTKSAIKSMATGSHILKVEFGLGESSSTEPKAVVCTGTVNVVADAEGSTKLAMNGPKYLRPLKDTEKGEIVYNSTSFIPGLSELTATFKIPNAPKYYNVKWCKATTCDYENGNLQVYVSLDNEPLAFWTASFQGADYSSGKSFEMVVFPKTDAGLDNFASAFNESKLFKGENPIAYSLIDKVYSGNLKTGKHTLKIKIYSQECVPYDATYEYQDYFFAQWPAIAENTIEINVTDEGKNALISSSTAKKLSHASGEWVAVDNKLIESNSKSPDFKALDVATQTEWKIIKNSLGSILYRQCLADVIYKSSYGCRTQVNLVVKEEYSGGGTYGNPYFASGIGSSESTELSSIHFPVPESKVK